jgi:hypothetical protein
MKTANKIFYSVVLAKLLAIGLVAFAASSQSKLDIQATLPTVATTNAQKIQTVLISTKRLTLEEKLAIDMVQARALQANNQTNKKIRKIA